MNQIRGPKGPRPVVQWLLQEQNGKIVGPLSTEDIIFRISERLLDGNEKIKKHPDGTWKQISREPEFYDHLLEALEKSIVVNKIKKPNKDEPEAQARNIPQVVEKPILKKIEPSEDIPERNEVPISSLKEDSEKTQIDFQSLQGKAIIKTETKPPPAAPVPETKKEELKPNKKRKENRPLIFIAGAVIILLALYIFMDEGTNNAEIFVKIKLPKTTTKVSISDREFKDKFEKILKLYLADDVDKYSEAQDIAVQLVESNPMSADAKGILCMIQKELWPFAKQDSKEIEIVQLVRKSARLVDPVGENGIKCEISYLLALGKHKDAMGLIDHAANTRSFEASPQIYYIKSELLAADRKYKDALAWASEAERMSPNWIKAKYLLATIYKETAQYEKAIEQLDGTLNINSKHKPSLINYGIILLDGFNNPTEAEKTLLRGLGLKSRVSRSLEAQGFFALARIYSTTNQQKALEFAQKAYELNRGDNQIKSLLTQLGGSTNVVAKSNSNNELVLLGDQYYRAGDCLSAQAEYTAAFNFDPKNAMAATKAARCLWQLLQINETFLWLNKAIRADPLLTLPYFLMADYYSQRFQFSEALQILNRASQRIPNNSEILKGYGLVFLRSNNFKEAIGYLERSKKLFDSDVETLVYLSRAYSANSPVADLNKAIQNAVKAIELDDANAEAHIAYAKALVITKGVDSALTYLSDMIKKYAYSHEFKLGIAEIYKNAFRLNNAVEVYENIILEDDKKVKAYIGLGESSHQLKDLTKALRAYLKAATLNPTDAEPIMKAGLVYVDAGRYKDAVTQFTRALEVNPSYPGLYYQLGKTAFLMKDYKRALEAAAHEKKLNPNFSEAYILAGDTYFALNDFLNCAKEFQSVIRLRVKEPEYYVKIAICQTQAGNLDIAESMLNIASKLEAGYADLYKAQGAIFEKKGEKEAAIQAFMRYLALSPNAPDKKAIEKRINALGGQL